MQGLAVRQVECGLNLTVALTTDGRIWQMGETGAPGNKHTPWEGAKEPQQVATLGIFISTTSVRIVDFGVNGSGLRGLYRNP